MSKVTTLDESGRQSETLYLEMPIVAVVFVLVVTGYVASMLGWSNFPITFRDLVDYWFSFDDSNMNHQILATLRAPRAYAGLMIGASLAVAGLLMQGLTRNPLASPSILGINAGAACFMAFAAIGVPILSNINPILNAVFGALLSGVVVMMLGGFFSARTHPLRLVLAGIAISALLLGLTRAALILADDMAYSVLHWLTGSLVTVDDEQWNKLWPPTLVGLSIAMGLARNLNLLALGDEVAVGLGSNIQITRVATGITIVLLAGTCVAIAGPIGFVGLLVPHLVRSIVGHNYYLLIPCSAMTGAALVTWSDALSRSIAFPTETPVGVVTALIGTPCFIFVAMRRS